MRPHPHLTVLVTQFAPAAWLYRDTVSMPYDLAMRAVVLALTEHDIGNPPREALALAPEDVTPQISDTLWEYFRKHADNKSISLNTIQHSMQLSFAPVNIGRVLYGLSK